MQSLNKNGVSITQTPGGGQTFYFTITAIPIWRLFSTVAKTLAECRRRRDEWIAKEEWSNK